MDSHRHHPRGSEKRGPGLRLLYISQRQGDPQGLILEDRGVKVRGLFARSERVGSAERYCRGGRDKDQRGICYQFLRTSHLTTPQFTLTFAIPPPHSCCCSSSACPLPSSAPAPETFPSSSAALSRYPPADPRRRFRRRR